MLRMGSVSLPDAGRSRWLRGLLLQRKGPAQQPATILQSSARQPEPFCAG